MGAQTVTIKDFIPGKKYTVTQCSGCDAWYQEGEGHQCGSKPQGWTVISAERIAGTAGIRIRRLPPLTHNPRA